MNKITIFSILLLVIPAMCKADCAPACYDYHGTAGFNVDDPNHLPQCPPGIIIYNYMPHKYSINDIDEMRKWTEQLMMPPKKCPTGSICGGPYPPTAAQVEDRLQLYMRNGITPEEIKEHFKASGREEIHY